MSDNTGPLSLSLNTSTAQTAIPTPVDKAWVKVRFDRVTQKTLEGKGDVLDFHFNAAEPIRRENGEYIQPGQFGSKFTKSVYLYGKDGPEAAMARANVDIGKILDALLGTGDAGNKDGKPTRPDFGPPLIPDLVAKECYFQAKIKTGEFAGCEMTNLTFPADMKTA